MDIQFSSDLESKLELIATEQGRDRAALVTEAVERFVSHNEWFQSEVQTGLDQISQGRTMSNEEVGQRLGRYLIAKQKSA